MSGNHNMHCSANQPTTSAIPLHDQRFEYRNSSATDVTITWRKFGWIPKGEQNGRQDIALPTSSNKCNQDVRKRP